MMLYSKHAAGHVMTTSISLAHMHAHMPKTWECNYEHSVFAFQDIKLYSFVSY